MSEKKTINQPWFIRRALYLVVGAVLLVAAAFGLVDEGKIDVIAASPAVGSVVAWIAAAFTHEGADSRATHADVEQAREDGRRAALDTLRDDYSGRHSAAPEGGSPARETPSGATYPGGDAL